MGYIVQSIVFDKDKGWDLTTAREWVKNHKEFSKPIKEEETTNTIRVRLFPPKKAEQMGFKDYRMKTLASGDVGIMLDIAYNKMNGGANEETIEYEEEDPTYDLRVENYNIAKNYNEAYGELVVLDDMRRRFPEIESEQRIEIDDDIRKLETFLSKSVEKINANNAEIQRIEEERQRRETALHRTGGMMNEEGEPDVAGVYRVDRHGNYLIQTPYTPTGRIPYNYPRGNLTQNEDIPLVEASPQSLPYQLPSEVPAISGNNFNSLQRFLLDRNARQNLHTYDDNFLYHQIRDLLRNSNWFEVKAKPFTKKQEREYEELLALDHLPARDRTPQTKARILELSHKLMNGSARGGSLSSEDLEALLAKSYSKNPEDYKDFQVDKSLSGQRVQVYHNPTTQQTIVAHRGTASVPNWIENVAYAVGNDKSGKAFQHSKKIQDQAYQKYGKENITTIGHSKGALHAQEYGKEGKEVITLNKPVNIHDVLFTRVPKSQTDIRTQYDPVSFLRPFQRGNKAETIKSTTKNPLKEHQTSVLGRLDPRRLFGGVMVHFSNGDFEFDTSSPLSLYNSIKAYYFSERPHRSGEYQQALQIAPNFVSQKEQDIIRDFQNNWNEFLDTLNGNNDMAKRRIIGVTEIQIGSIIDAVIEGDSVYTESEEELSSSDEEGAGMCGGILLPTISGEAPTVNFRMGNRRDFYFSVIDWVLDNNANLFADWHILQGTSRGKTLLNRNINSTIGDISMEQLQTILNTNDEDEIIEMLLTYAQSVDDDITDAINELQINAGEDSGNTSASEYSVGAGMSGGNWEQQIAILGTVPFATLVAVFGIKKLKQLYDRWRRRPQVNPFDNLMINTTGVPSFVEEGKMGDMGAGRGMSGGVLELPNFDADIGRLFRGAKRRWAKSPKMIENIEYERKLFDAKYGKLMRYTHLLGQGELDNTTYVELLMYSNWVKNLEIPEISKGAGKKAKKAKKTGKSKK